MQRTKRLYVVTAVATALLFVGLVAVVASLTLIGRFDPVVPTLSPDLRLLQIDQNQMQRPSQALYHIEAQAAQYGWTPELHHRAGDVWVQMGDPVRAAFHWEQAPRTDPALLQSLGETYIAQTDWVRAQETLEELLDLAPGNTWASYHLGLMLAAYDPVRAETYLQQAALDVAYLDTARAVRVTLLENRSSDVLDNVGIPVLVGLTLVEQEEWAYAELAFQQANSLYLSATGEPLAEALAYISLAQNESGKDGTEAIRRAVALQPNDAQIRFLEALHYRHHGAYQTSLQAMIQSVALSPENPVLYAELGTSYRLIGDLEQAEYWLRAAVAFSDNEAAYQALLAQFYAEEAINLGSNGIAALDSALQNNPNDPDLLAGMGWAFYSLGDQEEGRGYLEQALQLSPTNPRARYYMARVLLGIGEEPQRARDLLTSVVEDGSAFSSEAQRILQTLNS